MSYDLFLRRRDGAPALKVDDFDKHFDGDARYEVNGTQAWYENKDTGVYFSFNFSEESSSIAFNLNYSRPHTFGLEAERHVGWIVKKLDLIVDDPQSDGMGEGEYSSEGFLRGWNNGNRFAVHAISQMNQVGNAYCLPTEVNRRCWEWNSWREELPLDLIDDGIYFAPTIMFINQGGAVVTACIWGDAQAIAMPQVDLVIVVRRGLFPDGEVSDYARATWSDIQRLPLPASRNYGGQDYFLLSDNENPDPNIVEFLRTLPPVEGKFEFLRTDEILDQEIYDEARGGAN